MKKITFKPKGSLVIQFANLVEVEAIAHDGQLFLPTGIPVSGAEVEEEEEEDEKPAKVTKAAPAKTAKTAKVEDEDEEEDEAPKKTKSKRPTDKEMEKMTDDNNAALWDMVDEIPGLRKKILAADGKNTNKKIRTALLAAWAKQTDVDTDDEDEDEVPAKTSKKKVVDEDEEEDEKPAAKKGGNSKAESVLRKVETGDLDDKEAVAELVELGADKAAAKKLIAEFLDDDTAPIAKYLKKLPAIFTADEDEEDEEEEAPAKKAPAKGSTKKRTATEHDELEVDDEVTVAWPDGKEYNGVVASVGKKGIMIDYDDDTSDLLDDDMVVYVK